jgi:flagellar hook-associated protein 3 FlgL
MRANESIWYRDALFYINLTKLRYDKAIQQTTSGKKINKISDDPSGAAFALGLKDRRGQIEQFTKNLDTARIYLSNAEDVLNKVQNVLNKAVTDASEGATDTMDLSQKQLIANDIDQLRTQIMDLANTRVMNRYLFSGTLIDTQPFTETAGVVGYNGNTNNIDVQIGYSIRVTTNLPGDQVFMNGADDVFQVLADIRDHLNANDSVAVSNDIPRLGSIIDNMAHQRGIIGNRMHELDIMRDSLKEFSNNLQEKISEIEDANMPEAISNLMKEETGLRVTLQAASRIQRITLFDYLG